MLTTTLLTSIAAELLLLWFAAAAHNVFASREQQELLFAVSILLVNELWDKGSFCSKGNKLVICWFGLIYILTHLRRKTRSNFPPCWKLYGLSHSLISVCKSLNELNVYSFSLEPSDVRHRRCIASSHASEEKTCRIQLKDNIRENKLTVLAS